MSNNNIQVATVSAPTSGEMTATATGAIRDLGMSAARTNVQAGRYGTTAAFLDLMTDGLRFINPQAFSAIQAFKKDNSITPEMLTRQANLGNEMDRLQGLIDGGVRPNGKPYTPKQLRNLQSKLDTLTKQHTTLTGKIDTRTTQTQEFIQQQIEANPGVTDVMREIDPDFYANVDRAQGIANFLGQPSVYGQAYLDTASQGYQSSDIGWAGSAAAQAAETRLAAAPQMQAAQAGFVGGPQAAMANRPNNVTAGLGQASLGQLSQMQGAQAGIATGQAAQAGIATGQAARADVALGQAALANMIGGPSAASAQRVSEISRGATDVGAGALGQTLLSDATRRLASGGRLTPQEERDVAQSTRASFAARGLATSAPAAMSEALNRDRYARARSLEDRAYAQQVQAADIGRQQDNAQRQLSALQGNQQVGAQMSLADQAALNQMAITGYQGGINQAQFNTGNQQAINLANMAAQNQGNQFNAGNTQAMNLANMAALNQGNQFNAGNTQAMNLANMGAINQGNQFNAGNTQAANLANMTAANNMSQFNAGQGQDMTRFLLGNQLQADIANQSIGAQLSLADQAALNDMARIGYQGAINQNQFNAGNTQAANLANMQMLGQYGLTQGDIDARTNMFNAGNIQQNNQFNATGMFNAAVANEDARRLGATTNNQFLYNAAGYSDALQQMGLGASLQMAGVQQAANPLMRGITFDPYGTRGSGTAAINPAASMANQWSTNVLGANYFNANAQNWASAANSFQPSFNSGGGGFNTGGAATGALSGAATGAMIGSVVPGIGTAVGAIGGALIGGLGGGLSDEREKTDIKPLGTLGNVIKIPAYEYRYKGEKKKRRGVMAQDVQKVLPEAVTEVDYKGKRRLAIRPAVIGAALAQELTNQTKAVAA